MPPRAWGHPEDDAWGGSGRDGARGSGSPRGADRAGRGPAPPAAQGGGAHCDPPPITAPIFGPFRSVLAQGEGQSVSLADVAANQANGTVPDTFTSQQPLYVGLMP